MSGRDEFSVYLCFPDGSWHREREFISAKEAVELAASCSRRPAALAGFIQRIIIADAGEEAVFEWRFGKGVIFPHLAPGEEA